MLAPEEHKCYLVSDGDDPLHRYIFIQHNCIYDVPIECKLANNNFSRACSTFSVYKKQFRKLDFESCKNCNTPIPNHIKIQLSLL